MGIQRGDRLVTDINAISPDYAKLAEAKARCRFTQSKEWQEALEEESDFNGEKPI